MKSRLVIGCMTGTSLDGLDACLVKIDGVGLDVQCEIIDIASSPFPKSLSSSLLEIVEQKPFSVGDLSRLCQELSLFHFDLIESLISKQKLSPKEISLIALHGQTVYHAPPLTWQMIDPFVVSHTLKIPVVFDFRSADIAMGGQGAPLTPIVDYVFYRSPVSRAIVNLGGFCNITFLAAGAIDGDISKIRGFDLCVCNQILNKLSKVYFNKEYDTNGDLALQGQLQFDFIGSLQSLFFNDLGCERSLGTGDELFEEILQAAEGLEKKDVLRSVCYLIAKAIASTTDDVSEVVLAGGGTLNVTLVQEIRGLVNGKVLFSEELGIGAQAREAAAFAVLGVMCQDRVPITLPEVTGGPSSLISGAWVYP